MCKGKASLVIARLIFYIREAGESGGEELEMASSFPYYPMNRECHVKQNPDTKKTNQFSIFELI